MIDAYFKFIGSHTSEVLYGVDASPEEFLATVNNFTKAGPFMMLITRKANGDRVLINLNNVISIEIKNSEM